MNRPALFCSLFVVIGLMLGACGDNGGGRPGRTPTGAPRSFAMGLSSLPADLTEDGYRRAFELAASAGEVILIQRTPPWAELIAGDVSQETAGTTQREVELAKQYDLDLFVAIDPTHVVGDTSELAALPPELSGAGFGDPQVRRAFIEYAQYVAKNYHPKYIALGVAVNSYQHQHPEDFEQFVSLYHEAYQAVKQLEPDTIVFTIFQLEELQGLLPLDHPYLPQWNLIRHFGSELDLLALSSYPQLVFNSADSLPENYFSQVQGFSDLPIAIAGTGYSSETGGAAGATEEQQDAYLARAADAAGQLSMPLLVWLVGQDPTFTGDKPLDLAEHMGLLRQDGSEKTAWSAWEQLSRRPLTEG
jgi:hypothetical protein